MNSRESLTPEEREMEEVLSALEPAGHDIDRDRLMFEAGRASVHRARWVWPSAAAVLLAALVVSVVARPEPLVVERTVTVTIPPPKAEWEVAPSKSRPDAGTRDMSELVAYAKLRQEVLARGVEALGEPRYFSTTHDGEPLSVDDLLGTEPKPRGPRGPSDLFKSFDSGGNS